VSVTSPSIEDSLAKSERALDSGSGLSGTGFWSVVAAVKRNPELADRYAERIAAIDEQAHRQWAVLVIPLWLGTVLAWLAVLIGLGLVWWAYDLSGTSAVIAFFAGTGVLLGSTHGLGHLVVGRLLGMRFTYWFVGEVKQPQPGVKLDYATYLRTPPRRRAWMHASGALTTKSIPFLMIGAAFAADLPGWVPLVLAGMGTAMVVTDVFWSTKASDWKKFQREMEFAQDS
jgi:hypothetical protein